MPQQQHDSLYPDILFHFTKKENLFKILESAFNVSYAREIIIGKSSEREFAIPMVSFCDLRLTELKSHMIKYGSYGIGLTKQWANANGLNPVMYIINSGHVDPLIPEQADPPWIRVVKNSI